MRESRVRGGILVLLSVASGIRAQSGYRVEGVAGVRDSFDEPGPALERTLRLPSLVAAGAPGSAFVAESMGERIIAADGSIRPFATALPIDVAVDDSGGFYSLLPTGFSRFDADGQRTANVAFPNMVPGPPFRRATAIAVVREYVLVGAENGVFLISPDGRGASRVSPAVSPYRLALRPGSLVEYAIDQGRRRVVSRGAVVAGSGASGEPSDGESAQTARFGLLSGIAADSQNRVYVSDRVNGCIYRIEQERVFRHFCTPGREGTRSVGSISLDSTGNLLAVDEVSARIWRISPDGSAAAAIAGRAMVESEVASELVLGDLGGIALDNEGNLLIAEQQPARIRRISPNGSAEIVAGTGARASFGDGGPAREAGIVPIERIGADGAGWVYFVDNATSVRRFRPAGAMETWITRDDFPGLGGNHGFGRLLVYPDGSLVLFGGAERNLYRVSPERKVERFLSQFDLPFLAPGPDGGLLLASEGPESSLWAAQFDGQIRLLARPGRDTPEGSLCFGSVSALAARGVKLVVASYRAICEADISTGELTLLAGDRAGPGTSRLEDGAPPLSAPLGGVHSLAVSADGSIYFAERETRRVRRLVPD